MKKTKLFTIMLFLPAIIFCAGSQPVEKTEARAEAKPEPEKVIRYIDADGGLRMRQEPHLEAERITTIPNGARVQVLKTSDEQITISDRTGKWSQVDFDGKTGWVFGGFLSEKNNVAEVFFSKLPDYDSGKRFTATYWSTYCLGENAPPRCQLNILVVSNEDSSTGEKSILFTYDAGQGYLKIIPESLHEHNGSYILYGFPNDWKDELRLELRFLSENTLKIKVLPSPAAADLKILAQTYTLQKD